MSSIASYMQANTAHEPDLRFENSPDAIGNEFGDGSNRPPSRGKKFRLKLSQRLHYTAVLAFVSYLILLISFASPYWLSSYKFTNYEFKHLGLWDFCFQDFTHSSYHHDTKFNGCHWIYSPVYTNIRDWLQPPWFMFVQAMTTIALCIETFGLLAISLIFMHFFIQYQLIIMCITLVCHIFTTMLIGFAVIIFYARAFDRSWFRRPDYIHVDWAFFFAVLSMAGNGFASYLYYQEIRTLKNRMFKMKRLIVATSNGQSITGGDIDSLDAVYATKSVTLYNQSMGHENQPGRSQHDKEAAFIYPHFTQV